MFASFFDSFHRFLIHPHWGWLGLWLGLATLIVALAIMICTSWGQSHPLRKCAGLSLLAHLLLLGYATTVQIVTGNGNGHRGGGMNILLVDGGESGSDVGIDDPTAPLVNDPWLRPPPGEFTDPIAVANRDHSREAADQTANVTPTAPALLEVSQPKTAPPLLEVADAKPELKPVDNPPSPIADTSPPAKPEPNVPDLPPATATADTAKPVEKPTEPLPPVMTDIAPPTLPEQPSTSELTEWMPGPPAGGNVPTVPAPEGPLRVNEQSVAVDHPPAPSAANIAGDNRAATPPSAETRGPLVESAAAPIAARGVPEIYADRLAPDRVAIGRQRGGSPEAESAVQAALRWLAIHQSADGRWDASRFGAGHETAVLGQDRQGAGAKADTAMTGLALLAFLGAGNTHLQGDYSKTVQRALEFLLSVQGSDGNLAGDAETFAFMYSHGIATLSMSEAYALTGDKRLEPAVQSAINYTLRAQIRSTGGWRYSAVEKPVERGDTSQLGWQLMSLKSAELAGIRVPTSAADGAVRFLKSVSTTSVGGKASYRPGEAPSRTMTAEALVCRQFLGMARDNPASNEAGDYIVAQLPSADRINLYYWYYGTLGTYQLQGEYWRRWNEALQQTLVNRQRLDDDLAGSWDPDCIWGGYGGRIYSTAMSALCLEVYYRYLPIYRLAGRQTSQDNGR